eukprot:TRINITY_DN11503_c0_g1_i4.p1 TRINITY_DN11503_c0_g1~~TRINITY_DN11503_c0_g1_i4.p1  ORF type:complete len:490 (+),score=140.54 TRINITY_DN11503_c0_g1_i4:53-1471(+)
MAPQPARRMWLGEIRHSARQVELHYGIDDLSFTTTVWYGPEMDLHALRARVGADTLDKILFHVLAFEANKVLSLGPETLDVGPYAKYFTPSFIKLWQYIGHKVWAQWRYQHNRPHYQGPKIDLPGEAHSTKPVQMEPGDVDFLAFCGGGKDSLVCLKLLESAGLRFSTLAYAHNIYGLVDSQHALIDRLLDTCSPVKRHKQWVCDTFVDAPLTTLYPEYQVQHLLAAETPSSIFGVLPLVLHQGIRYIVLGHERSADTGNLIWDVTGEDVNHQWGKSLEAEAMLNKYIQEELIQGFTYFSLLKPLFDVNIFSLLKKNLGSVPFTHSCNILKPWCKRCPKCAYVWLNYMAYLPVDLVNSIFGNTNLLDLPENQLAFRQMVGLEAHTPFECIGQVPEAQLAMELLKRKGITGQALDVYSKEVKTPDWDKVLQHYTKVVHEDAALPKVVADKILPIMLQSAKDANSHLRTTLGIN